MVILETTRLILRHLEPGDLDSLHGLYCDPEIRRHFPDGTLSLEQTREELEWFRNEASAGVARRVGMAFEREHDDHFESCHIYARSLSA